MEDGTCPVMYTEINDSSGSDTRMISERESLLKPTQVQASTKVYRRRWWVLGVFSLSCFMQTLLWNTWGPITKSAELVFRWGDGQIGMLANWGNIAFLITVFPLCYFIDTKGLRLSQILCTFCMLLGTSLRCITTEPDVATWLINVSAMLNGVAGTVILAAPALVASKWFPPHQRATATAVGAGLASLGMGISFIIGPQLVTSPKFLSPNNSVSQMNSVFQEVTGDPLQNTTEVSNFNTVQADIMKLMYIECGVAGLLFLATILYFPDKPPTPPSITASITRVEYRKALYDIIRNRHLWLIALAYAVPSGIYGVYGATIDIILRPLPIGQREIGMVAFYTIISGFLSTLVIARFTDIFMRHMKIFLITLYVMGGGAYAWVTLLCLKVIPFTTAQLYIAGIVGGISLVGTVPLFYELCSETAYPVSEGVVGGFIALLNNVAGSSFLLVLLIPGIGRSWMNYSLLGSIAFGLIFLVVFQERYRRTDIDITVTVSEESHVTSSVSEHSHVYKYGGLDHKVLNSSSQHED